jgi:hypothetical protein
VRDEKVRVESVVGKIQVREQDLWCVGEEHPAEESDSEIHEVVAVHRAEPDFAKPGSGAWHPAQRVEHAGDATKKKIKYLKGRR